MPYDNKEYCREWRRKNREHWNEYNREYRKSHREQLQAKERLRHIKRRDKQEFLIMRLKKLGLSLEDFETMWLVQNGLCAICQKPLKRTQHGYGVDHNHKTGKVRGLLCNGCNTGLGFLEKTEWKALADNYLLANVLETTDEP